MRIVVVGNGIAGTMAAKTLRELDASVEIEVFTEEAYGYYPRPNLIEFIAGNLPYERLFAFPEKWHERQDIALHFKDRVVGIDLGASRIKTRGGHTAAFDKLLFAGGSSASVPPIKGVEKKGVFVLKTLDDALAMLEYVKDHPRVSVLGGGLLGLELARALRTRGAQVTVYEVFDRLLSRQLDAAGAECLKGQIEKTGIAVRLGVAAEEIMGSLEARGLKFKNAPDADSDMIVVAAGIKPNVVPAKDAGLDVDDGIVVDDFLRTSHPAVFAAGDAAEHRHRIYGIIPAAFDQARAAAFNMLGLEKRYEGTVPSNTLKVAGIFVTSVGIVNPGTEGEEFESLIKDKRDEGIYKKLVLRHGVLAGAIWMGTKKGALDIVRFVSSGTNVEKWKNDLLEDAFDFSHLGDL